MRTHFIYSIFILAIFVSACNDILEESPRAVDLDGFYNTVEDVQTGVNSIYTPLRSNMAVYHATLECHSDFMYGRGSWEPISQYQGLNDANINRVAELWDAFYLSIRNANLIIFHAPQGDAISVEDANSYVAEARFLRAFNYFNLVRNWGALPLRTEGNMEERDLPKSSVDDVYQLIEADLLMSEEVLPEVQTQVGRPTRWSAKALLADVYLELERYEEAADRAYQAMQSNRYGLVPIVSKEDFQNNLYGPEINTSTEEVFALKYARQIGQGNYILWISNHPSTNNFNFGGAYAVHGNAENPNYQEWEEGDIRKQLWDTVDFGLGPNTLVSSKFIDRQAIEQGGGGNDNPIYRYADVLLLFAEASTRATGTVSAEAMEALNQVHRRAYGYNPAVANAAVDYSLTDYNANTFTDLVIRERGYEFQYEGKRWLELKRTDKVNELIQRGKGLSVAAKHLLWPIPISEMNYNKALDPSTDQNPGY
ncbi:RagB/SusD family nutrient uptake outer membrane protein [Olivibacter sp. SDN3]|uniref:RagB/SusD family nutrient uptake outer membrane protein n=1 Tax=Olivibacter sp. SDN3 TaxID=2764720 RepID=UPI001651B039|nr:RagB/SusD family nutrient uptake outer membrane protein [Olivibacter sp. SDN3]QNL50462.1 RagB/SusD family nutrient uptake outer membrane protein [Olivibacter sp. SDN3]